MKEYIDVNACAPQIMEALKKGILLNTQGEKFNSMVIGWGALGRVWNVPAFTVYVRRGRYTKGLLDAAGEFTISVPLDGVNPEISRVCGSQSGRNVDKAEAAHLTLEPAEVIHTPGVREYPLTLECRVLYAQEQDISILPEAIRDRMYPQNVGSDNPMSNRDPHTAYIGEIVSAYIIR